MKYIFNYTIKKNNGKSFNVLKWCDKGTFSPSPLRNYSKQGARMWTSSFMKSRSINNSNHKIYRRSSKCVGMAEGRERMLMEADLRKSQWSQLLQDEVIASGPITKPFVCCSGPWCTNWYQELLCMFHFFFFFSKQESGLNEKSQTNRICRKTCINKTRVGKETLNWSSKL